MKDGKPGGPGWDPGDQGDQDGTRMDHGDRDGTPSTRGSSWRDPLLCLDGCRLWLALVALPWGTASPPPAPIPRSPPPPPRASTPCSQRAASRGQTDGARHLLLVIGVSDGEADPVLLDLHEGRQGLGDVLGGDVQRGTQALGRHRLHLPGELGLSLGRDTGLRGAAGPAARAPRPQEDGRIPSFPYKSDSLHRAAGFPPP